MFSLARVRSRDGVAMHAIDNAFDLEVTRWNILPVLTLQGQQAFRGDCGRLTRFADVTDLFQNIHVPDTFGERERNRRSLITPRAVRGKDFVKQYLSTKRI
ncbi:MAG: hypothetical protein LBE06_11220 [Azoarcus sp.]|jgi:hypothetical protein|nr:hypothetical protein [Azoarcus sp.]